MKDPYEILGVSRNATDEEIKKYLDLLKKMLGEYLVIKIF